MKKEFRLSVLSAKVKNVGGKLAKSSSQKTNWWNHGAYRTFWKIAELEGGLMDREFGIKVATSICFSCEKRNVSS